MIYYYYELIENELFNDNKDFIPLDDNLHFPVAIIIIINNTNISWT